MKTSTSKPKMPPLKTVSGPVGTCAWGPHPGGDLPADSGTPALGTVEGDAESSVGGGGGVGRGRGTSPPHRAPGAERGSHPPPPALPGPRAPPPRTAEKPFRCFRVSGSEPDGGRYTYSDRRLRYGPGFVSEEVVCVAPPQSWEGKSMLLCRTHSPQPRPC